MSQDTVRGSVDDYGSWNLYGYCAGNPVCYVDPSGHTTISIEKDIIDTILYYLTGGISKKYRISVFLTKELVALTSKVDTTGRFPDYIYDEYDSLSKGQNIAD